MTRKEKNKIQELEAEAWEALCKAEYYYVRKRFPFGYGYANAQRTLYTIEDMNLRDLSCKWRAYNFVAIELKTGTQFSSTAHKYNRLTYEWLEGIQK